MAELERTIFVSPSGLLCISYKSEGVPTLTKLDVFPVKAYLTDGTVWRPSRKVW